MITLSAVIQVHHLLQIPGVLVELNADKSLFPDLKQKVSVLKRKKYRAMSISVPEVLV